MKNLSTVIACALLMVIGAALFLLHNAPTVPESELEIGSTIDMGPALGVATTSTSVSVTSSARLIATTTTADPTSTYRRIFARFCTASSNPVYLNIDGDKPASLTRATAIIAAAAGYENCFELNDRNPYNGSVQASSTAETASVVTVQQWVVQQ